MYQVLVSFAPAHELVLSLDAFLYTANKGMDMGPEWVSEVSARMGADKAASLRWATAIDPFALSLLVWQCPGTPGPEEFLQWLSALTPGQLYERMSPYVPPQKADLLRDLGQWQGHVVQVLRTWHEGYFRAVEPRLLAALAADAERRRGEAATADPVALVEEATTGLRVESESLDQVLLVPQTHLRPLVRFAKCNRLLICLYPLDAAPTVPGRPAPDLMRTVRALADENRLRIMHFLADSQPRSFTDVMKNVGLAKNTIHYHLSALRTAGLVRFHLSSECDTFLYTARRSALDEIGPRLQRFLDER